MLLGSYTASGLRSTFVLHTAGADCWLAHHQQQHSLRKERPAPCTSLFTTVNISSLHYSPEHSAVVTNSTPLGSGLYQCHFVRPLCASPPKPYLLVSDICKLSTSPSPFVNQMISLIFSCISNNNILNSRYSTARSEC